MSQLVFILNTEALFHLFENVAAKTILQMWYPYLQGAPKTK